MGPIEDWLPRAAVFLIIPAVIMIGSLLMDASICITIAALVWIVSGIILSYVPATTGHEDRS